MYYLIISLLFSIIAIFSSFPIAISNGIPLLDALTDYLAYITFSGCLCGFILILARPLTKIKFNPDLKIFKVPEWEQRFYKKIKIDKWKFIIPDCGNLVKFKKKINLSNAKNADFYKRFLYENINASILHFFAIILTPVFFLFIHKEF